MFLCFLRCFFWALIPASGFQDKASMDDATGTPSKSHREESRRYNSSRETLANKYAAIREQHMHSASSAPSKEKFTSTTSVSLLDSPQSQNQLVGNSGVSSSGLSSTWASMKNGFQNFKANVGAKKFLPLRQLQQTNSFHTRVSSSESLDDIFQRLKQKPSRDHSGNYGDNDSDNGEGFWKFQVQDLIFWVVWPKKNRRKRSNVLGSYFGKWTSVQIVKQMGALKFFQLRGSPDDWHGDSDTYLKTTYMC